jgi:hypothetical protein
MIFLLHLLNPIGISPMEINEGKGMRHLRSIDINHIFPRYLFSIISYCFYVRIIVTVGEL